MHHCSARLIQSVPIREWFEHETVWEGAVHIFDLEGHPTASRAYAWSSSIEGSDNRRFFAVLHQPPITSPVDAVRAAIVVCIENLIRFECLTESLNVSDDDGTAMLLSDAAGLALLPLAWRPAANPRDLNVEKQSPKPAFHKCHEP